MSGLYRRLIEVDPQMLPHMKMCLHVFLPIRTDSQRETGRARAGESEGKTYQVTKQTQVLTQTDTHTLPQAKTHTQRESVTKS